MTSAFQWRTGEPSIFATDPAFASRVQGGSGVAPQPMPGTRFPNKNINTEPRKVVRTKKAKI